MRIKGTDRKNLQRLAETVPSPDGYAELYPTARRRIVDLLTSISANLENTGLSLVIEKPESADERGEELMRLYDLTAAEARLALHLAEGGTLRSHAAGQNISRNTVRSHLQSIFQKMAVNRQAAVVRLVLARAPA